MTWQWKQSGRSKRLYVTERNPDGVWLRCFKKVNSWSWFVVDTDGYELATGSGVVMLDIAMRVAEHNAAECEKLLSIAECRAILEQQCETADDLRRAAEMDLTASVDLTATMDLRSEIEL